MSSNARYSAGPLVSVIIPTHNAEKYLRQSIDSVLSQDYTPLEVIIVDDGSTDGTQDILAEYRGRICAVRQENGGAATARNNGLARASGKYIAFLDSDDVWLPGKLHSQVTLLEDDPSAGLVFSRWRPWYPDSTGKYPPAATTAAPAAERDARPPLSGWLYTELLLGCLVWTSTVVIRRGVADAVGRFDPALRRGQDYDYWLRASRLVQMREISRELALYRMDDNAVARKAGGVNWEFLVISRAVERWGARGPDGRMLGKLELRRRFWQLHFSFGYQQYHQGSFDKSAEAFAAALHCRPFHPKTQAFALASRVRRTFR